MLQTPDQMVYITKIFNWPEFWARSYAQFVATRCGRDEILNQLNARRYSRGGVTFKSQWTDTDFLPIDREIENIFKKMGWIN
jgi:hypothetical protein